jgi:subtilisin-like proprotein convertase family protein
VADTALLTGIKLRVDLDHTYIGHLLVTLRPPTVTGVKPVVLHNRAGGGADNLKTSYDPVNAPGLAALIGKKPTGTWVLSAADREAADTGTLHSVTLELSL